MSDPKFSDAHISDHSMKDGDDWADSTQNISDSDYSVQSSTDISSDGDVGDSGFSDTSDRT